MAGPEVVDSWLLAGRKENEVSGYFRLAHAEARSRAMLRDMLGADIDAQKSVSVSRQFADDFEAVAAHYNLHQLGEYELAKNTARRDIEAAQEAFAAIAAEIRKE